MKQGATYPSEVDVFHALTEMRSQSVSSYAAGGVSPTDMNTPQNAPSSAGSADAAADPLVCLLKQIVVPDYQPRFASASVRTESKLLRRMSRWLHYEFQNRLSEHSVDQTRAAIQRVAALDIGELLSKSRIELRSVIEHILSDLGFPPLSEEFNRHNARVNADSIDKVSYLRRTSSRASTAQWLLLLAVANKLEIWPSETTDVTAKYLPTHWTEFRAASGAFRELGERVENQVLTSGIVGLFADNHGEIAADLAFLEWLQQQYGCKVVLFAKDLPVETDVDVEHARRMIRETFPFLKATVVSTGSRVQGTLLTRLTVHAADALRQIAVQHGLVVVKGLANLETVPGLLIDGLFLLTAKTPQVANMLDVPLDAAVGLWLRPGHRLGNCGELLSVAQLADQLGD